VAVSSEREIRSRRKHISKAQRRLIWEYLDEKYGLPRHCYAAGCARTDVQQDHKDGNRNNTVLQNMQPSCPIHQKVRTVARKKEREWERTRVSDSGVGMSVNADSRPGDSYEVRTHVGVEPAFRSWVIGKLVFNGGGPLPWEWFVLNGAEIFKVMPVTTDRYLEKMTSESGPLEKDYVERDKRMTKMVRIKPEFWSTAGKKQAMEVLSR
jgi:hypothetical protein